MSEALIYEKFVLRAFGIENKGDDPAGLAHADIYNFSNHSSYLTKLKIGTTYAMCKYARDMQEKQLNDEDTRKIDQFIKAVFNAEDCKAIISLINQYEKFQQEIELRPIIE